jgi:hypothetical protein
LKDSRKKGEEFGEEGMAGSEWMKVLDGRKV